MGRWMAYNLTSKTDQGPVHCYDLDPKWKEKLSTEVKANEMDATVLDRMVPVATPQSLIQNVDVLVTSLPHGNASKQVSNYIVESQKIRQSEFMWIDTTTLGMVDNKAILADSLPNKFHYIDAPVSGGVVAARNGALSFMLGCADEAVYARSLPYVNAMGAKSFHVGGNGAGLVAKICNNLLLSIEMVGTCEALALGKNLGVDVKKLTEVMSVSTSRTWSLDTYNPVPGVGGDHLPANHANKYSFGFQNELMNKDLNLALEAAATSNSKIVIGKVSKNIYEEMVNTGHGKLDFGSIWDEYQKK